MLNKTLWNSLLTTTFARKNAFNFPFEMSRFSFQDVRHLNVSLWYTQQTCKTTTLENQLRSLIHLETMKWKASQMPPFIAPFVKSLALVGDFCDVKGISQKNALPETLECLTISCYGLPASPTAFNLPKNLKKLKIEPTFRNLVIANIPDLSQLLELHVSQLASAIMIQLIPSLICLTSLTKLVLTSDIPTQGPWFFPESLTSLQMRARAVYFAHDQVLPSNLVQLTLSAHGPHGGGTVLIPPCLFPHGLKYLCFSWPPPLPLVDGMLPPNLTELDCPGFTQHVTDNNTLLLPVTLTKLKFTGAFVHYETAMLYKTLTHLVMYRKPSQTPTVIPPNVSRLQIESKLFVASSNLPRNLELLKLVQYNKGATVDIVMPVKHLSLMGQQSGCVNMHGNNMHLLRLDVCVEDLHYLFSHDVVFPKLEKLVFRSGYHCPPSMPNLKPKCLVTAMPVLQTLQFSDRLKFDDYPDLQLPHTLRELNLGLSTMFPQTLPPSIFCMDALHASITALVRKRLPFHVAMRNMKHAKYTRLYFL